MNLLRFALFLAVILAPVASGCQKKEGGGGHTHAKKDALKIDKKYGKVQSMQVVCTTGMVADLVKNIGGPHVKVEHLMQPGVDPHQYLVSPGDLTKLNGADIVFYSGLHLEGKMYDTLERLGKKLPTVAVADYLPHSKLLPDEEDSDAHDPHVWFDVLLWSQAAAVAADALVQFDPAHAADYKANLEKYQAQLKELHDDSLSELKKVPTERRVLITSHDAFRYFGKAYAIEVKGLQGINTNAEAGVKDVNEMVKYLVDKKVKAIFVETIVNPSNMKAVQDGCKAQGHEVILGGELFSDAMGAAGTPEGTYIGMIRHNVSTIVKALQ